MIGGGPGGPGPVRESTWQTSARWRTWSSGCWAAPVRRAAAWRSGWPLSGSGSCSGSRDADRAAEVAAEVAGRATAAAGGVEVSVQGGSNVDVAGAADLVIVAVPYAGHAATLAELATPLAGKIVVDCVVPMGFDELGAYVLDVEEGSVTQQAAALLPDSHVVGAFHHLSAVLLEDLSRPTLDGDVMVVGDDREATDTVQALAGRLPGMRGIYAGPAAQRPPGRGADHQPRVGQPPVQGARRHPDHRRLRTRAPDPRTLGGPARGRGERIGAAPPRAGASASSRR